MLLDWALRPNQSAEQPDTRASPSAYGLTGAVGKRRVAEQQQQQQQPTCFWLHCNALQNSPAPLGGFEFIRLDAFFYPPSACLSVFHVKHNYPPSVSFSSANVSPINPLA